MTLAEANTHLYALSQRFSVPSIFFTLSFDEKNDMFVIKLSIPVTSKTSFPATVNTVEQRVPFSDYGLSEDDSRNIGYTENEVDMNVTTNVGLRGSKVSTCPICF